METTNTIRRRAQDALRRLGFSRRNTSRSGSSYYEALDERGNSICARIADHDVPLTDARERAVDGGGFSWATHGHQVPTHKGWVAALRVLAEIRREARRKRVGPFAPPLSPKQAAWEVGQAAFKKEEARCKREHPEMAWGERHRRAEAARDAAMQRALGEVNA